MISPFLTEQFDEVVELPEQVDGTYLVRFDMGVNLRFPAVMDERGAGRQPGYRSSRVIKIW